MQPERLGLREIGGISVVAKASAARDFFRSFLIFQKRTRMIFFLFFLLDEKEPKNQENLMLSAHMPTHARPNLANASTVKPDFRANAL